MEGWSFCIVTAPGNNSVLEQCVENILVEFRGRSDFEVIVVGNLGIKERFGGAPIRDVHFDEEVFSPSWRNLRIARKSKSWRRLIYRTGAISHKKNLAARESRYNKLCIMHDYVGLLPGWRAGFEAFGSDWDVAMTIIRNADGTRHRDWMCWNHPHLASDPGRIEACLMPYDVYTKYMYISGTYFCVKRDFFLRNPLSEKLFWGEGEDVEWSLRVRELTRFRMNINSTVRYLKLKSLTEAPYCKDWVRNRGFLDKLIAGRREI